MTGVPFPLPDPPLRDGPMRLRAWRPDDAVDLAAAWSDPLIVRWTGVPSDRSVDAAARWIAREADRRARGLALDLVIDVEGAVSGEVGLAQVDLDRRTAEIGWWVERSRRGQGLAASAAGLFSEWVLSELALETLTARCQAGNPASSAVARRAGFVLHEVTDGVECWSCC